MFRRRPVRRGRGIVGTVATTAVVAGTATVAAKAVGGAMDSHAQAQQQTQQQEPQQQPQQQQAANAEAQPTQQTQPQQMPVQSAAYQAPAADLSTQLQQLAQLKESGALSDEEFQAAKAKILG